MVNFKPDEYRGKMFIQTVTRVACDPVLRGGALWRRGGKRNYVNYVQLRLWNFNSASNSPVASRAVD